jgi:hypothetical protein
MHLHFTSSSPYKRRATSTERKTPSVLKSRSISTPHHTAALRITSPASLLIRHVRPITRTSHHLARRVVMAEIGKEPVPSPAYDFNLNDTVILLVGPEEQKMLVHAHQITVHSEFFAAALKKEWVEGQTR